MLGSLVPPSNERPALYLAAGFAVLVAAVFVCLDVALGTDQMGPLNRYWDALFFLAFLGSPGLLILASTQSELLPSRPSRGLLSWPVGAGCLVFLTLTGFQVWANDHLMHRPGWAEAAAILTALPFSLLLVLVGVAGWRRGAALWLAAAGVIVVAASVAGGLYEGSRIPGEFDRTWLTIGAISTTAELGLLLVIVGLSAWRTARWFLLLLLLAGAGSVAYYLHIYYGVGGNGEPFFPVLFQIGYALAIALLGLIVVGAIDVRPARLCASALIVTAVISGGGGGIQASSNAVLTTLDWSVPLIALGVLALVFAEVEEQRELQSEPIASFD